MTDDNIITTLMEYSFQKLHTDTKTKFDTPRDQNSKRVQVFTTNFIPSVQNNSLEIRAKTKTDKGAYDSLIYLENVEYVQDESDPSVVSFKSADNTEHFIKPVEAGSNVKVNCTCLDFYYRLAVWNDKNNALQGDAPQPYVRKPNSRRPPANPSKTPGVCKHLIKLFDHIKREGIVK